MRLVCLLDNKIPDAEFEQWRLEDVAFWRQYIGITPTYQIVRTDYSDYPTFIDADGDIRPTDAYLRSLNDQAVAKFGEWGFDFLLVMVHQDNWKSDKGNKKLWGTNFSYVFGKQCLQYCRWDKKNLANSFGTAYHERHHSLDAICKVEVGVDVNPLLNLGSGQYDKCVTHGGCTPWSYIRHKENTDSLKVMAPHLRAAFSKREQRHKLFITKKFQLLALAEKAVYLLKMALNRKNGVPRW